MNKKKKILDVIGAIGIWLGLAALTAYFAWNLPEHLTTVWR